MSLRKEFQEFVRKNPNPTEEIYTTIRGVDFAWSDKLKAWKVDMAIDINKFLAQNTDIKENLLNQYRDNPKIVDQINTGKISRKTILHEGFDLATLDQVVNNTDIGVRTAYIGQRTRSVKGGTMSSEAKSKFYSDSASSGSLTLDSKRFVYPEGGGIILNPPIQSLLKQYPVESNSKALSTGEEIKWTTGSQAKARNKALLELYGITEYWDEQGHRWKHEGKGGGKRTWRNRKIVNWREMGVNPTTDEIGTGFISKIGRVLKRRRGMETTTESDAENFREMKRWITEYNNQMKAKHPGDNSRLLFLEHRIKDADWKAYKFPGSSHDAHNLWVTTYAEKLAKDSTEGMLNRQNLKDKFLVDYDPETRSLHIIPREKFGVGVEPTSVSVADFKLSDNIDADSKGLRTLVDQIEQPYIRTRNRHIGADQSQNTYQFNVGERTRVNPDGTITLDQPNIGAKLKNWGGRAVREAVDPRSIGLDAVMNPFIARQLGVLTVGGEADWKGIGKEALMDVGQTAVFGGLYKKLFSNPYTAVPAAGYAAWRAADAFYEGRGEVTPTERFIEPFTDPDEPMSLLGPLPE